METLILILMFLLTVVLPPFLIWFLWRRYLKNYLMALFPPKEDSIEIAKKDEDKKNPNE